MFHITIFRTLYDISILRYYIISRFTGVASSLIINFNDVNIPNINVPNIYADLRVAVSIIISRFVSNYVLEYIYAFLVYIHRLLFRHYNF